MDIFQTLAPLTQITEAPIAILAGVFMRISALVFFLPGLGEQAISPRVRLGAAFAIAFVLTPIVLASTPVAPSSLVEVAPLLVAEAVAGALIGFSIRIAVFALQTAGAIASQTMSLQQLFGGGLDHQQEAPMATLFMIAGVALAVSAGIHFKAVGALALSYEIMPFGLFPGADDAGGWAADRAAFAFSAAFSLSLPFVVLGFVYNLAIGAANRAMPQLMVAFVGAPAITLAGLTMLALATPLLLGVWLDMVDKIFETLIGALG
ncbi:MAG: flagellar biosynthetic protein FliR [Amphiplicatus sp.]